MQRVDYLLSGEYVLTMREGEDVLRDGAVAVSGGRIYDVGPEEELKGKYTAENITSGKGKAVMPGLVNTHTHAAMSLLRGIADDLPLKEWLEGHIWPTENRWLSPEYIHDAARLACLEMLKAGVTAFSDMYFYQDVTAEAVKAMGMRAALGPGIVEFPTKATTGADDCLKKAERFIEKWKGDEYIKPSIAPHSAYTCGPDTLKDAGDIARRHGVVLHIHLAETKGEVQDIRSRYAKAPAMLLDELGLLDCRLLAAHCVWLTHEEIGLMAEKGAVVSHCAESNLKLASGFAPVQEMLDAGIKVTFGTDGAASNNDLDVLGEMSTAAKLEKAVSGDPTTLDARTALTMATRWGAEAVGLEEAGSLRAGNLADIVVIDLLKPHLTPLYDIYSHLVYAARASDVETVMVNGRVVVEGGELKSADEGEILKKARQWGERIKSGT
jgi:5-methylthioadenosine/S-adenosylhomocysteine deaminase